MVEDLVLSLAAIAILCLIFIVLAMVWRRFCCYKQPRRVEFVLDMNNSAQSLQDGTARLHQHQWSQRDVKKNNHRRGGSTKPLFNWADHPSLITDAVENGWSRFGFAGFMASSPSTRSSLMGLCTVGDQCRETEPEISWEVSQGSADFMQKIRINPGLKKVNFGNNLLSAASVIRATLPLPGPPLGSSAFPQEAYFEITILCDDYDAIGRVSERTKLIKENFNARRDNSESLVHVASSKNTKINLEELKINVRDEAIMFSVGLTAGGSLPLKLPGSFPGSIGFNSNGSVYLDGTKLVFQSETAEWGRTNTVIGCGFNPREKKVFFTLDSELVHVIHCKTQEFGTPLYPTLAANTDILVLVNFGQSVFSYAPANAQRTANPCFIGPLVRNSSAAAAALGYEDSRELFSMGRIDSQWLNRSAIFKGNVNNSRAADYDEESEADLFEIMLDSQSIGKSPSTNIVLQH